MSAPRLLGHGLQGPDAGAEGTVLLLNGGMMSYPAWQPIADPLAHAGARSRGLRVVSCDFRGQLLSPGEPPESLAGHARDVLRLLDALDEPSVHVLGTSFGAAVGLVFASRHPDRVRSLALVTATDRITAEIRDGVAAMRRVVADVLAGGDPDRFHDHVIPEVYSAAHRRDRAEELAERRRLMARLPREWFEGLDGILAAFADADIPAVLEEVPRVPSLVALAADDRVIPPQRSRALAAALGADRVEHPTSGHALVAEAPEWVVEVYRAFLRRLGPTGGGLEDGT